MALDALPPPQAPVVIVTLLHDVDDGLTRLAVALPGAFVHLGQVDPAPVAALQDGVVGERGG